jgi:hypothetical protein
MELLSIQVAAESSKRLPHPKVSQNSMTFGNQSFEEPSGGGCKDLIVYLPQLFPLQLHTKLNPIAFPHAPMH